MTLLTTSVDFQGPSVPDSTMASVISLPVENPLSIGAEEVVVSRPPLLGLAEIMKASNGKPLSHLQMDRATRLIAQVSREHFATGQFIGWKLALHRQGAKELMSRMFRANPALREHIRRVAPGNKALESAVQILRRSDIGTDAPAPRWRLRGEEVGIAVRTVSDMRISSALELAVRPADGSGALVRDVNATQTHVLNSTLTNIGNALVREFKELKTRVSESPELSKLLHNLIVEEPLISQGVRDQIAKSGMAPELGEFFEDLHVSWNVDCQLAATDRSEATLQLVAADGESLI